MRLDKTSLDKKCHSTKCRLTEKIFDKKSSSHHNREKGDILTFNKNFYQNISDDGSQDDGRQEDEGDQRLPLRHGQVGAEDRRVVKVRRDGHLERHVVALVVTVVHGACVENVEPENEAKVKSDNLA